MQNNKSMQMLFFIFYCVVCCSCTQKELVFKIGSLKPQELRIYYNKEGYPRLPEDSAGRFIVRFDTVNIIYTSTTFTEIKNHRNVFCFEDQNNKCLKEDWEIETLGFNINTYSHFSSDGKNIDKYEKIYDQILIEKIKTTDR